MKRSLHFASMNLRVGILVSICAGLIFLALFFPIRGISPFASKAALYGEFDDVDGLKRNSPVFLAGMEAGTVQWVNFLPAGSAHRIRVKVMVDESVLHFIRRDSVMKITSMGLLGDKFVEITAGSNEAPQLASGDTLVSQKDEGMMAGFSVLQAKVAALMDKANVLLASAESKDSNLGKLLQDGRLYDELVEAVHQIRMASANLNSISGNVNQAMTDSKIHETFVSTVASVHRVVDKVEQYTDKVDRLRFYLDLNGQKFPGNQFASLADIRIMPDDNRFYAGGVTYSNVSNNAFSDTLTYDAALGFRVFQTPLFFWGGLKRSSVGAGLDLGLLNQLVDLSADASHFERSVSQVDFGARIHFYPMFALTGGVDDTFGGAPLVHAGLTVTYDDRDLTTILIQLKTGL